MSDTPAAVGGKRNKWLAHVKKTMKAHKGKSFKAILRKAKESYTVKGGAALSPAEFSSGGPTVGGRRRKTRKATRKGGKKH